MSKQYFFTKCYQKLLVLHLSSTLPSKYSKSTGHLIHTSSTFFGCSLESYLWWQKIWDCMLLTVWWVLLDAWACWCQWQWFHWRRGTIPMSLAESHWGFLSTWRGCIWPLSPCTYTLEGNNCPPNIPGNCHLEEKKATLSIYNQKDKESLDFLLHKCYNNID